MNVLISFLISQIEIIALFLVMIKWKYRYKEFIFFNLYILYSYVTDLIGHTLINYNLTKIAIIEYNLYILLSTILIVTFLGNVLRFKIISKGIILVLFILIWIADNMIINSVLRTNSICRITSHTLIIFLSFYTIKKRIEIYNFNIRNEPVFIIVVGFCLNSLFRIIYEIIYLTNIPTKDLNIAISYLIPVINFLLYSFFIYALICLKKPMKLISHY